MTQAWLSIGIALVAAVQAGTAGGEPPSKGRTIFVNVCARCHGVTGTGHGAMMKWTPPVPDLTSSEVQSKLDAALFHRIHEGRPDSAMGAWKTTLSEDDVGAVLAYVRTLAR